MSHPTMGAWIEISKLGTSINPILGRTPRWVRGLKYDYERIYQYQLRRTPRWVRGLKSSRIALVSLCL